MDMRTLSVPGLAVATALAAASLAPVPAGATTPVYLAAVLDGANEVPVKGTKAGDQDGSAIAVFRVHGHRVEYAVRWHKIAAPSGFHIHRGQAGENGEVKIPFFGQALPATLHAVKGAVTVKDRALLGRILNNPGNWYANVHNKKFAAGAARAQLHRIRPVALESVLSHGFTTTLTTRADGRQEVPAAGTKVGDRDGRAGWLVQPQGGRVWFAAAWERIGAPVGAHLHRAPKGKNGPVAVPFLAAKKGLPAGVNGVAGSAAVSAALARRIWNNPGNWYANLHTAQFPGGAIRGQLYRGDW
ncbi:CHRD domain-containing protein [Nonomuraea sp. KC401]|uniref:CHRD domain-containing protein n=1 Tax=unclassified Nonomuraea TaxID=2593643 RepID=UPI0010FCDEB8|nr:MULTISPECIES: CHRD domain-containing protein [unclassified Nonomuraea]NBE98240.1 CHRD domain-containing protein [Nonomuraea sp. K271]TLF61640.1 CHRD domain-containing protein [Nonomuraea sp. KC401]